MYALLGTGHVPQEGQQGNLGEPGSQAHHLYPGQREGQVPPPGEPPEVAQRPTDMPHKGYHPKNTNRPKDAR